MKRCPTCQKTYEDEKRFCQIDGTSLVDAAEAVQTEDPFKTVVVGKQENPLENGDDMLKTMVYSPESKDDDILQLPDVFDPMKTMVVSDPAKFAPPVAEAPVEEPIQSPEPPKFSEPSVNPPVFSEPIVEAPKAPEEPAKPAIPIPNPFNEAVKGDSPFSAPAPEFPKPISPPQFGSTPLPSESEKVNSPFSPTPSYGEPEPFNVPSTPFGSPFDQPSEPQSNSAFESNAWTPPPAPNQNWQDQQLSNTPFQPPAVQSGGQNQTLGIITLVLGIVSLLCLGFLTGIPSMITGFMTMKNVSRDPIQYGGKVMAIIGMVLGGLGTLWSLAYAAFILIAILSNMR